MRFTGETLFPNKCWDVEFWTDTPRREEETVSTVGLFLGIPIRFPVPRRRPRRLVLFLPLRCFLAVGKRLALLPNRTSTSSSLSSDKRHFASLTALLLIRSKLVDGSTPNFHFSFFFSNISFYATFMQSFLEHVRPFLWDFCLYFEINEYLLQMVILEYEPFFDFNKVKPHTKKKKKKRSRFPSKSSRLTTLINAATQHENATKKLLTARRPSSGSKHRQTKQKKIVKAQDLMTRPI